MIQTLITMAIAIGIGAFLGIAEVLIMFRKDNQTQKTVQNSGLKTIVTGKDLIQRRGSWRFALDHVLFAEIFYQQVQNEANIKVR